MRTIQPAAWARIMTMFLLTSCARQQHFQTVTESQALVLARAEFIKSGHKIDDYRITLGTNSDDERWIVWFDEKGTPTPGGSRAITIEKKSGKTHLLPQE